MNRKDLQILARTRLREAKALLTLGLNDGAFYLAGYSVECALKACIAKATQKHEFPDRRKAEASHTHSLKDLVRVAGLERECLEQAKIDLEFRNKWNLVQSWSEQSRYSKHDQNIAKALIDAIDNRHHGVLAWVKRYW